MLTAAAVAVRVLVVVALGIVTDSIRTTAAGVLKVGGRLHDLAEGAQRHPRAR